MWVLPLEKALKSWGETAKHPHCDEHQHCCHGKYSFFGVICSTHNNILVLLSSLGPSGSWKQFSSAGSKSWRRRRRGRRGGELWLEWHRGGFGDLLRPKMMDEGTALMVPPELSWSRPTLLARLSPALRSVTSTTTFSYTWRCVKGNRCIGGSFGMDINSAS